MARKNIDKADMRTIVLLDAVNFTKELKEYGRPAITPKVNQLKEYAEFFFVYKLKGELIGQLGDGFLVLCPPTPAEVINEAIACQSFIAAYNHNRKVPAILNARIAIHFGLIAPPEGGNYIDSNLNLTSRLEGATPPNCICISSVLYQIVADALRGYTFEELESEFKGLGQNKYYIVSNPSDEAVELTRHESRLSFYFSTIGAFRKMGNWEAVRDTCEQALVDFPDNPEFTSQLAFSFLRLQDYPHSISAYERCIQMDYDVGGSLFFIAQAYRRMGDETQSLAKFEESIENQPDHFHSMANIARIYLKNSDYAQARKWAKKSLKFAPRYILPISTLITISLIEKNDDSLPKLIGKIQDERRKFLRTETERMLEMLGVKGYKRRLSSAFSAAKKGVDKKKRHGASSKQAI
jgi:hypothetical protein